MLAEPGAHQLGAPPVRMQGLDGLRQRDGPVFGDRRALLGLAQAGMLRPVGGKRRRGQQAAEQENRERLGDRHGWEFKCAPVNAG